MRTHRSSAFLFETAAIGHHATAVNGAPTADRVLAILTANLNLFEQSVWLALLDNVSIDALARTHRISRAAIHRCVAGENGMTSKNQWVARWWDAHRQLQLS
jgi:hypothetical protein